MPRENFIERSLWSALSFFKESIFSEELSRKPGFLQKLATPFKLAVCILSLIAVSFVRQIHILISIYIFTLFLAYISKINIWFFIKRVWVFIPIFAGIIAIPAIFNIFTPGEPIYSFFILGKQISITKQGLFGAVLFVSRVAASVSIVVLLTITARQIDILKSLRSFKVPKIFVMTLGMMYRYVFLFIKVLEDMHLATKSRLIKKMSAKSAQRWVGSRVSTLYQKSRKLSEDVYLAMVSRGYTGEPK